MSKSTTGRPDAAPSGFLIVRYFEAFGMDYSCLVMSASHLPSSYSQVYFESGQISRGFDVDLSGYEEQFKAFSNPTYFKNSFSLLVVGLIQPVLTPMLFMLGFLVERLHR